MSIFTTAIQHHTEDPNQHNKARNIKIEQIGQKAKLPLFTDDMITDIENAKETTEKLLQPVSLGSSRYMRTIYKNQSLKKEKLMEVVKRQMRAENGFYIPAS